MIGIAYLLNLKKKKGGGNRKMEINLVWYDPEKQEKVKIKSVILIRAGSNDSIIVSVVELNDEVVDYYCDEVYFL